MTKFFKSHWLAFALIAPQILITVVFFLWPAVTALLQSLFQGDAFGLSQHFAGFDNFFDLLNDKAYLDSVGTTLVFSGLVTFITMACGLLIAVLVNATVKAQGFYKSFYLWPYAVAPAVAGILWRFLFNPAIGWVSYLAKCFGYEFNFMLHPGQAMLVVVIAASWQQFSYNFLFFFAGLQAIPQSLLEAATIDGANAWQKFWHIIFPLLSPTTFFLLVINVLYAFFDTFGIIQVMTHGGPGNSTSTLVYKVYNDGFIGLDLGSSAAQSVVLMLMVGALTVIQFRFIDKKVVY